MFKKLTLLALALGALVAFAVPAVASADTWTAGGESVGSTIATGTAFDGTGEFGFTTASPLGTVKFGPCHAEVEGNIWNQPTGHGGVEEFRINAPCPITIGGKQICSIEEAGSVGFPWTIQVQAGTRIDISGANVTQVFNANCPLGPGFGFAGTATGTYSNATSGIVFNEDGHMKTPTGGNVFLDGGLDLTRASDGAVITLH